MAWRTASAIKDELKGRIHVLAEQGIRPGLATLLVGDDPGSLSYVGGKHRDSIEVGIESVRIDLPGTASEADVRAAIADLNADSRVTGFIVQLPLPGGDRRARNARTGRSRQRMRMDFTRRTLAGSCSAWMAS